jgi:hypothetical protein
MSQSDERRRYFRIEDAVSFTVSMIDPGELQTKIDAFWDKQPVYSVYHQSNQEVEQHLADLEVIEKGMPELAILINRINVRHLKDIATMRSTTN